MTAVCYYFSDVEKNIDIPPIIELKLLEETKKQSHSDGLTGFLTGAILMMLYREK
jgi:hypothetical protein